MSEFTDSLPDNFKYEVEMNVTRQEVHVVVLGKEDLADIAAAGVDITKIDVLAGHLVKENYVDDWSLSEYWIERAEPDMTYCKEGREMICNGLDEYEPEESSG